MAKWCCGANRETPHCPQCGVQLGNPSPLISLLKYIRIFLARHERALAETRSRFGNSTIPPFKNEAERLAHEAKVETYSAVREARKKYEKWKSWADAVDAAIRDDRDARVIADWLMDNDEPAAAARIRGAFFCGDPPAANPLSCRPRLDGISQE